MFNECTVLTSLDLSNCNIVDLRNAYRMFYNCQALTSLDLSSWNTSKLTNILFMFGYCSRLASLDIRSWDLSNVTDYSYFWDNCSALSTVYANGKVIEQLKTFGLISSSDMFTASTIYQLTGSISNGVFTVSSYIPV